MSGLNFWTSSYRLKMGLVIISLSSLTMGCTGHFSSVNNSNNIGSGADQTGAWQNGVWKREFQYGIALWNPRGDGPQTVSLSGLGNLKHICGKQENVVNNCESVTNGSITIPDEDGAILLRY